MAGLNLPHPRSRQSSCCSSQVSSRSSRCSASIMRDDTLWDDWVASDAGDEIIRCLFCSHTDTGVAMSLAHAAEAHNFDVTSLCKQWALSLYERIRLINFLRAKTAAGVSCDALKTLLCDDAARSEVMQNDEFLKPFDSDDRLLFNLDVLESDSDSDLDPGPMAEVARLRAENDALRALLTRRKTEKYAALYHGGGGSGRTLPDDRAAQVSARSEHEASYFDSYSRFSIHLEMLSDTTRTEAYRNAMERNASLLAGKVVLDVGCGTGILSLFAARAGARLVIGVDNSDIVEHAREVVKENGYQDKIVLIRGRMEDVVLPVDKVDIIVSEWMGYFLFFESMLETVLFARDRYLAPGGSILPDRARMYVCGATDRLHACSFWASDIYGFKFTCLINQHELEMSRFMEEPEMALTDPAAVLTNVCLIKDLDLAAVTSAELDFSVPFTLTATRDGTVHALVAFFDVDFFSRADPSLGLHPVHLSTSPFGPPTHWKQTVFGLKAPFHLAAGQEVSGRINVCRNSTLHRQIDVCLLYRVPPPALATAPALSSSTTNTVTSTSSSSTTSTTVSTTDIASASRLPESQDNVRAHETAHAEAAAPQTHLTTVTQLYTVR